MTIPERQTGLKRVVVAFLAFSLAAVAPGHVEARDGDSTAVDGPVGDKWALVVGISHFKDPAINLKFAAKDATDFANYLVSEAKFAPDHVKLLTNEQATQKTIMSELGSKWLPRVATEKDLVVIFISSHGSPADMDIQGVNYIVAHDSDVDDLYTTAIEMQDLVSTISRRVHAKRLVVFLDSCHSGAADTGAKGLKRTTNIDLDKVPLGSGQLVISSSQKNELSWELKNQQNGAFTYCLLDALRKQHDAPIPQVFEKLQDSVQQTVMRERGVMQTPVLRSTWKGKPVSLAVVPVNPHVGLDDSVPTIASSMPPVTVAQPVVPPTPPVITTPPVTTATPIPTTPPVTTTIPTIATTFSGQVQKPELPDSVAIIPFPPARNINIQQIPANMKVYWGTLKGPEDLQGLPTKLAQSVFQNLRSSLGGRVLGPRSVQDGLTENNLQSADTSIWTAADWQSAGRALQAKYLVSATIDEVDWATSVMANKYGLVVSAKLVSAETGEPISEVKSFRVKKAPFQGDVSGGRKYFENTVAPIAANQIAKTFSKVLSK